jgi:hypothetical protein
MTRVYGRAPVGERLVAKVPDALRVDGVTAPYVIDRAIRRAPSTPLVARRPEPEGIIRSRHKREIVFDKNAHGLTMVALSARCQQRYVS